MARLTTTSSRIAIVTGTLLLAAAGGALLLPSSSPSAPMKSDPSTGARQVLTEKGIRFSFNVPADAGWERFNSLPTRKSRKGPVSLNKSIFGPQGAEAIIYWTSFPEGVYADPCTKVLGKSIGSSAAALAAAVSSAPGTRLVEASSVVTLGGRSARHVVLRVRENVGCDPGFFYAWRDVFGGPFWRETKAGDTIRIWIVPVHGTRLFIAAATTVQANLRLDREIEQIVGSIRFE